MKDLLRGPQIQVPAPTGPPASFHWISFDPAAGWPYDRPSASAEYPAEALPEFAEAIRNAGSRIWIVDPFFDYWCGFASIADACASSLARDIWILSGRYDELTTGISEERPAIPPAMKIRVLPTDLVHDRFALVDDDLWHFGSTVGGGYHKVSAVSRGWRDQGLEFQVLFQNLWRQAGR